MLNTNMLNKQQSVQITLLFMIFVTVNFLFLSDNMISLQAITKTSSDSRGDVGSNSNGILNVDNEKSKLINELVKTGKFTKEEAQEFASKVMLIDELVKTGKFTKEEAQEFASKVMNNETDGSNTIAGSNISEANLTANVPVPEANLTANVPVPEANANLTANVPVPEANLTANVPVPEANLTANVPVPEANLTANVPVPEANANLTANVPVPEANLTANVPVPEANLTANVPVPEANLTANVPVPEANLTANVPGSNISQNKNSDLVTLDISVKQNPIFPGEEQSITLTTFDPITGAPLDPLFVRLIIKDPLGNVIRDYTDNDGKLSPSFVIGENDVGTFTILGTALQAGVESTKSLTFQVK
jgi:polyhydroxyalkanoate synthesis regulator phasin